MTFTQIWSSLCKKQPKLEQNEATVEFKSKNLKLLLRQVYEQGQTSVQKQEPKFDGIFDHLYKNHK